MVAALVSAGGAARLLCLALCLTGASGAAGALVNPSSGEVGASVQPAAPEVTPAPKPLDCKHGEWDAATKGCQCDKGWATAGITDTVDFLEGVCEQYHCESAEVCRDILGPGFEDALCPVRNWNCYCGFGYSFMNNFHGYETSRTAGHEHGHSGAECMGFMYAFSLWCSLHLEWFLQGTWKLILFLAMCAIPFGRKRVRCDCTHMTLWNLMRRQMGRSTHCDGRCPSSEEYWLHANGIKDDLAWSLFILDVGLWVYVFLCVLYVIVLFIWSVILWMVIFITCVCMLLAALCMMCGEGGGGADCNCNCDCNCCGDCGGCCPTDNFGAVGNAPGADMYYGGAMPDGGIWFFPSGHCDGCVGTSSNDSCCCCPEGNCCRPLFMPLAFLCRIFPRLPENMWGGLCGRYCFGTHQLTPADSLYRGGSCFVDMLRFQGSADLHENLDWRNRVWEFLQAPEPGENGVAGRERLLPASQTVGEDGSQVRVGGGHAWATLINRSFNQDEHRCVESSFKDYQDKTCWICQDAVHCESWDLWLQCRHIHCARCSEQMLRRRMPCPLCRMASTHVLRGKAFGTQAAEVELQEGNMDGPLD